MLCMDDELVLRAWVASIGGVGPRRFESLRQRFGDLSLLLSVSKDSLLHAGVPEKLAGAIIASRDTHPPETIRAACKAHDLTIIDPDTRGYPPLLQTIHDPPIVLYVQGTLPDWNASTIAVVGTRSITAYGRQVTTTLTRDLVRAGCIIVSGFMFGVDAIAHQSALENDGVTVGVLGYGFGVPLYPRTHEKLRDAMLGHNGCLLSEFPPWQHPVPGNFPQRNRIVAGISNGVVVTEAAARSGSRITAEIAADLGRDVFAVPGPISSPYSEGTKELINLGATLVTSATDILDGIGIVALTPRVSTTGTVHQCDDPLQRAIVDYLETHGGASTDELLQYSSAPLRTLLGALGTLELRHVIESAGIGLYRLCTKHSLL